MNQSIEALGYDHIKVVAGDLTAFKTTLSYFGFSEISDRVPLLQNPAVVMAAGEAVVCLYEPSHALASEAYKLHGDTIFDLSFVATGYAEDHTVIQSPAGLTHSLFKKRNFKTDYASPCGVIRFDHNTVNVEQGKMQSTVDWYVNQFQFEKGQYFDIRGKETGLYSWVTRSKNRKVQIPFNEAQDAKSQIQEFIDVHRGPGVQHLALLTTNILHTMKQTTERASKKIRFLDIPDTYYTVVEKKVKIKESLKDLSEFRILVDQDAAGGYLLQIFSQNVLGAFFFELIQREGNEGFGEGNFQSLFDAMELDQKQRGVL